MLQTHPGNYPVLGMIPADTVEAIDLCYPGPSTINCSLDVLPSTQPGQHGRSEQHSPLNYVEPHQCGSNPGSQPLSSAMPRLAGSAD